MLESLHIENVAVIKELDIDFENGFTVFTGETGAGKSIIIDSIKLLLGAKADKGLIRSGESSAFVSAVFSDIPQTILAKLEEMDVLPDDDGNIVISRSIASDGKSRSKVGTRLVSSALLHEIGDKLIAIHGQHESMKLLDSSSHLSFLDSYSSLDSLKNEYFSVFSEMNTVKNQLRQQAEYLKENTPKLPLLKAALKEIKDANIKSGEEEKLESRRKILKNSAKLSKNISIVTRTLKGSEKAPGAVDLIKLAENALSRVADDIADSELLLGKLREISSELEGIAEDIGFVCDNGDFDSPEQELSAIEERLGTIDRLTKKYGNIDEYKSSASDTIEQISKAGELCEQYKDTLEKLSGKAFSLADELTSRRKQAAAEFEKKLLSELEYLDLEKVRFKVSVTKRLLPSGNVKLTSDGCDDIKFMISPNVGEEMKELSKIASGGEMSRIMLALCCVFADKYGIPSMIFDEIDTGISGKTSEKIGIKLRQSSLSGKAQVFCVTHSAQVASCAHCHIKIEKHEQDGRTVTGLHKLLPEERVDELSRIMGGMEITPSVRQSAREMIEKNSRQ